jgi:hypothetical protein
MYLFFLLFYILRQGRRRRSGEGDGGGGDRTGTGVESVFLFGVFGMYYLSFTRLDFKDYLGLFIFV